MQKIDNTNDSNTLHDYFRKRQCRGTQNIIIHVLETSRDGKALPMREREIELKRIELLRMDRLKSEYPQGLNCKRLDDVERQMYYK